MFFSCEMRLSS